MSRQTNSSKMLHRCLRDERYRLELDRRADNDLQDEHLQQQHRVQEALAYFDASRHARSILS